jgi:hypothetical protein
MLIKRPVFPELEMDDGDMEPRIPLPREFLLIKAKSAYPVNLSKEEKTSTQWFN